MVAIYLLRDPRDNAVRYVGQTCHSLPRRLSGHIRTARAARPEYSSCWIRTLLAIDLKPLIELIEETAYPDDREAFWITFYRSQGARLTNVKTGGNASRGHKRAPLTPEQKAHLSAVNKGRKGIPWSDEAKAAKSQEMIGVKKGPHSAEHRRNLALAHQGKTHTPAACAKIKEARSKQMITPAHRQAISLALKGKPRSPECRQKIGAAHKGTMHVFAHPHPFAVLTPEQVREIRSHLPMRYGLGRQLAKEFGVSASVISCVLKGKTYQHVK